MRRKASIIDSSYEEAFKEFIEQLTPECRRVGPLAGVLKDEEEFVGMINMKVEKLEHEFLQRQFKIGDEPAGVAAKKRKRQKESEMLRETALEIAAYGFAMYLHNREKASRYTA